MGRIIIDSDDIAGLSMALQSALERKGLRVRGIPQGIIHRSAPEDAYLDEPVYDRGGFAPPTCGGHYSKSATPYMGCGGGISFADCGGHNVQAPSYGRCGQAYGFCGGSHSCGFCGGSRGC